MRLFPAGLAVLAMATGTALAETFPYEASVVTDGATVHSGPGGRYYATSRLNRGAAVTVHRHEPGGWHMIAPPPGSFSWIRAEYVKPIDSTRGELIDQHQVVVRVGSSLDDSHTVEQVRLARGDTVEILGEATLNSGPGPVRMYKIKPPRGEFRWIQGRHLIPADPARREQHDRDPFAVPSNARRTVAGANPSAGGAAAGAGPAPGAHESELPGFDRPIARSQGTPAVRRSGPGDEELAADRHRLSQLDGQFRRIIQRDAATWDFSTLERDYRRLHSEASVPALASQVELRLQAIERYRQQQREQRELRRLISETSRRDAELLAMQAKSGGSASRPAAAPGTNPGATQAPPAGEVWRPTHPNAPSAAPWSAERQGATPNDAVPRPLYASQSTLTAGPQPGAAAGAAGPTPRFDGAGIIQRAATTYPGAPRHVLLAPNGRVLSYLDAPAGLDLDAYVGQSVGIFGPRQPRHDLRADLIVVHGLMPVRLVPAP
jgi:hypothetical protein